METVLRQGIALVSMVGAVLLATFLCVMHHVSTEPVLEEIHNVPVTQDGLVFHVTSSCATNQTVFTATALDPMNVLVKAIGRVQLVTKLYARKVVLMETVLLQMIVPASLDGKEPTALTQYVMQGVSMEHVQNRTTVSVTLIFTEQSATSLCATQTVSMELAWKIQQEDPITVSVHRGGEVLTVPTLFAHSMVVNTDSVLVQMTVCAILGGQAQGAVWICHRLLLLLLLLPLALVPQLSHLRQ
jgi:hypothetical protein